MMHNMGIIQDRDKAYSCICRVAMEQFWRNIQIFISWILQEFCATK